MNYVVAFGGLWMVILGAVAMLAPRALVAAVMRWPVKTRFSIAVGIRLLLGVIFLEEASSTRFPAFVFTIGVIAVAAAVILFFLGPIRVDAMIRWWLKRTSTFMRLWALVGVVLGAAILYAALA